MIKAVDPLVLDFDMECRPLAWYGGDFVTKQPTAVAWKFIGTDGPPDVKLIGLSDRSSNVLEEEAEMLMAFKEAYDKADIVTGHFIRGFDLPTLQGAFMRLSLPLLGDKDTQDTKLDLLKVSGLSQSQENLGAQFELAHPKIGMNTSKWAAGNMLLPHGIEATRERVVGDVEQHIELRQTLLDHGYLGPVKEWKANNHQTSKYHA
jgi:hypothetical protein